MAEQTAEQIAAAAAPPLPNLDPPHVREAAEAAGPGDGEGAEHVTEAAALGWVPQDQWKGPADKWKPAKDFLDLNKSHNGMLRENFEKLERRFKTLDGEHRALMESTGELMTLREKAEQVQYKRARDELKTRLAESVGDPEAFRRALEELDVMAPPPQPKAKPTAAKEPTAEYQNWEKDNAWFKADLEMRAYAMRYGTGLRATGDKSSEADFLATITSEVRARYPDKFRAQGKAPGTVDGGSERGGDTGKRGRRYEDLPPEAKAAADKYAKQMVTRAGKSVPLMTREEYVKNYDWSN